MNDYADDCIHLKACRRCAKIYKARNGRSCNPDTCSAYISGDEEITTVFDAVRYARDQAYLIRRGHDELDVFVDWEVPRQRLGDYINDLYE